MLSALEMVLVLMFHEATGLLDEDIVELAFGCEEDSDTVD